MKLKLFLFALLAQCVSLTTMAYDAKIDGIYYEFSGTEACVVKGDVPYSGDIVIPQNVTYMNQTYDVTEIGYDAFNRCVVTSVSIPNSVTNIGTAAFEYCSGLTSIAIPESVTAIGSGAFFRCFELKSISIPESVTVIGHSAFDETAWLYSQPDGLVYAGKIAYTYLGTMPENTAIEIKEGTLSISSYAFKDCSGLTAITIPESVTSIGVGAFNGTAWFDSQPDGLVYAGKVAYKYKGTIPEKTAIEIKDGTLGIASYAFNDCSGLTSITIPEGVTCICDNAFSDCHNLISVAIPESVTSIGYNAFAGCYSLTSITIPKGVTCISQRTFVNCI